MGREEVYRTLDAIAAQGPLDPFPTEMVYAEVSGADVGQVELNTEHVGWRQRLEDLTNWAKANKKRVILASSVTGIVTLLIGGALFFEYLKRRSLKKGESYGVDITEIKVDNLTLEKGILSVSKDK